VAPLHDGAMFVAARTGAKVVPVGIGGSDRAMPKGAKLPRPLKITIVVGAPSTRRHPRPCHSFGAQCQKRGTTRGLGEGVSPEPARLTALDLASATNRDRSDVGFVYEESARKRSQEAKKAKVKTPPRVFDDAARKSFTVPKLSPTPVRISARATRCRRPRGRSGTRRSTWRPFLSRPTRAGTTRSALR